MKTETSQKGDGVSAIISVDRGPLMTAYEDRSLNLSSSSIIETAIHSLEAQALILESGGQGISIRSRNMFGNRVMMSLVLEPELDADIVISNLIDDLHRVMVDLKKASDSEKVEA